MDTTYFYYFLITLSSISSIAPIVISLINLKFIKTYFTPYFALIIISLVFEISNVLSAQFSHSNLYLIGLYTEIEFTLISLFYIMYFKTYFKPIFFWIMIPVFFIIAIIEYVMKGFSHMNNLATSMESIIFVGYSLFFYFYVMQKSLHENLLSTPVFWLNSAVLTYFSGNLLLFIFSNYLAQNASTKYMIMWATMHTFFNIMYNIFLSVGFWKTKEK